MRRISRVLMPVLICLGLALSARAVAAPARHLSYEETVRPVGPDAEITAVWQGHPAAEPLLLPVPARAAITDFNVQRGRLDGPGSLIDAETGDKLLRFVVKSSGAGPVTLVVRWRVPGLYAPPAKEQTDDEAPSGRGDLLPLKYSLVNSSFSRVERVRLTVELPQGEEVFTVLAPARAPVTRIDGAATVYREINATGQTGALALGASLSLSLQRIPQKRGGTGVLWAVVVLLGGAMLYSRRDLIRSKQREEPGRGTT